MNNRLLTKSDKGLRPIYYTPEIAMTLGIVASFWNGIFRGCRIFTDKYVERSLCI